jgi:hypothetical protein
VNNNIPLFIPEITIPVYLDKSRPGIQKRELLPGYDMGGPKKIVIDDDHEKELLLFLIRTAFVFISFLPGLNTFH